MSDEISLLTYIEDESFNVNQSLKIFPKEFKFFDELDQFYGVTLQKFDNLKVNFDEQIALYNNCYRVAYGGFSTIARGNIRFSYGYLRLIAESTQYSIFLSTNKEYAKLWKRLRLLVNFSNKKP